ERHHPPVVGNLEVADVDAVVVPEMGELHGLEVRCRRREDVALPAIVRPPGNPIGSFRGDELLRVRRTEELIDRGTGSGRRGSARSPCDDREHKNAEHALHEITFDKTQSCPWTFPASLRAAAAWSSPARGDSSRGSPCAAASARTVTIP